MTLSRSAGFQGSDSGGAGVRLGFAVCALGLALVYLNLIPLRVTWLPVSDWLQAATSMPWLRLSVARRADWIANLFMFVPFGFLLGSALGAGAWSVAGRGLAAIAGCVIVVVMAYAIETLQILVPQRTVSLNDVLAASLGGFIGLAAWVLAGPRLWNLARAAGHPTRHALLAGLALYCLFYAALSPFPYDFLLSAAELRAKLAGNKYALLWVGECSPWARCAGQVAVETLVAIPFGMALAVWLRWRVSVRNVLVAALAGCGFGVLIEVTQFLTFSGVTQGVSLLTRGVGFAVGAVAVGVLQTRDLQSIQWAARTWAGVAWLPYLVGVFLVTGFAGTYWGGVASAAAQLAQLNFQPFYYHYFVPEQVAMASLLYTTALYFPVGVLLWPWRRPGSRHMAWRAAAFAACLALCVETLKLFALDLRPDPTNVLIAALAAWAGMKVLVWLVGAITSKNGSAEAVRDSSGVDLHLGAIPGPDGSREQGVERDVPQRRYDRTGSRDEGRKGARRPRTTKSVQSPSVAALPLLLGAGLGVAGLAQALTHPLSATLAIIGLLVVVALVYRWPWLWLVLVPATLPVLDLRPWSGRLYFDEWDLLVLAVLSGLWLARGAGRFGGSKSRMHPFGRFWLWLYLVSYAFAVGMAIWPPTWPDLFALTSLHADYNALRLAKGVLWALLLWPFFDAVVDDRTHAFKWFAGGMMLGLAGAIASVLWERTVFTGLFDYSQHYRVVGFFSDTHTGGAFLEGYLVAAVPFLAAVLSWRRRALWWPLAVLLFVGATYSIAVTFARAGYAGLMVAILVVVVAMVWRFGKSRQTRLAAVGGVLVVAVLAVFLLMQVQDDEFMSQRVEREQIERDWNIRVDHWRETLAPVLRDTGATWFGMGVGRFPETNYWEKLANGQQVPAIYQLGSNDRGDIVLNLMPGLMTYHWQAVSVEPDTDYTVRVRAQSNGERVNLGVMMCEQWLIYSRRCVWRSLPVSADTGDQPIEVTLRSRPSIANVPWLQRPVKFGFYHSRGSDVLQVESVSLVDPTDRELLVNGDFSQGLDRWFFASDDHLAWHVKHVWGQVFFEQGLIGLLAWSALLATAIWVAARRLGVGGEDTWPNAIVMASLLGFLSVGLFDSLFDAPRLATLFYLLVFLALSSARSEGQRTSSRAVGRGEIER